MKLIDSRKADKSELSEFIKKEGLNLPDDYIKFLCDLGGGENGDENKYFKIAEKSNQLGQVDYFYPFYLKGKDAYLPYYWYSTSDYMPRFVLPIASDDDGNTVLIGAKGSIVGKIYYQVLEESLCDSDISEEEFIKDPGIFELAASFSEFVDSLSGKS